MRWRELVQRRDSWLQEQRSPTDVTWRSGEERVILLSYGLSVAISYREQPM